LDGNSKLVSLIKDPVTPSKKRTKARPISPLKRRIKLSDDESDSEESADETEKDIKDPEKIFFCKFAIDSRRGIFYTFKWERHRKEALARSTPPPIEAAPSSHTDFPRWGEGCHWDVKEEAGKSSTRHSQKSRLENDVPQSDASDEYQDSGVSTDLDDIGDGEASDSDKGPSDDISDPRTPSKKRKRDKMSTVTPRNRKRMKTLVEVTPHSKVALSKRRNRSLASPKRKSLMAFPVRYPAQSLGSQASMAHIPRDPWLRSMHALHVGSRPDTLPCREEEYARVLKCVGELLEEGSGGCICKSVFFFFCYEL
jgi:origin recognition complex subunit 1